MTANHKNSNNRLLVFLKYPEPGKVKTRLAEEIGEEKAARLYATIAKKIIEDLTSSGDYDTVIFYDPPEKEGDIRAWLGKGAASLRPQSGDTLGDRIINAFADTFSEGTDKAVIIGTDCVDVTAGTVNEAFTFLDTYDAVIGPARDGGYYLLGLNHLHRHIFENIDWSTGHVLSQTLDRISSLSLSYVFLQELNDIDTVSDLRSEDSYLLE